MTLWELLELFCWFFPFWKGKKKLQLVCAERFFAHHGMAIAYWNYGLGTRVSYAHSSTHLVQQLADSLA